VLATRDRTGSIQQRPVLLVVDDDGRFVISSSRETGFKTKNVRRDRAHLCVFQDGFFGDWESIARACALNTV
jgi:hypothetical protein